MAMNLQIQLRVSDPARASFSNMTDFEIRRPRMNVQLLSVSQSYAAAIRAKLAGSGVLLNYSGYETFFSLERGDCQIVVPSNKRKLKRVFAFLLDESAQTDPIKDAFRSSICGTGVGGVKLGKDRAEPVVHGAVPISDYWDLQSSLLSYQFQCGPDLAEAVTTEQPGSIVGFGPNTGQAFLENYLRCIGASSSEGIKTIEHWGSELCASHSCKKFEGGELLPTFLCKRFVMCYAADKLNGEDGIESGVDTQGPSDIVLSLRFNKELTTATGDATARTAKGKRVMFLMEYAAQLRIKNNDVEVAY